ncbi:MAG: hypothetical protein QOH72_2968 [Solirubrobacteraceae bacterium]|nr:hypothetical protein [Solirubrobacteraceae bacterium]
MSSSGTVAPAARVRCGDHLDLALTAAPTPRDASPRGFRRVAAAFFVLQAGGTLPVPLYVLWKEHLGFGTGTLTLVFAVYALGTLTSLLLLAPLSDLALAGSAASAAPGRAARAAGPDAGVVAAGATHAADTIPGLPLERRRGPADLCCGGSFESPPRRRTSVAWSSGMVTPRVGRDRWPPMSWVPVRPVRR